jgi:hypothetical protein
MPFLRTPAALACVAVLLAAVPARAEDKPDADEEARPKLIGLRAEAGLTSGFGMVVSGASAGAAVSAPAYGNVRIGYDFPMGFTALLHLGLATTSTTFTPGGNDRAAQGGSASIFSLGVEGRYYFTRARTEPFVFGELNKTFVGLGETAGGDPVQQSAHNLEADRVDTFGFAIGAGAEHGFTRQFALGAKWGLDFNFRGYTDVDTKNTGSSTQIGTAAEFYAAFRF